MESSTWFCTIQSSSGAGAEASPSTQQQMWSVHVLECLLISVDSQSDPFPWDHVIWMLQQTFLGSIHKSPLALIDSGLWLYVSSRVESEKCPVFTQLMSVSTYPPSTRCGNHRHQRPCSQCGLGDRQTSVCNPAWGPPWELQSMEEHHAQIGDREGQRGVPGREPWNWELEKSKG